MTDGFASRYARTLGATMVAGLVAGFVAAGIGSRLTMRILAVTTHPLPAGFRTEAEAQVGKITTGGTVFLLLIGAVLTLGAMVYLIRRDAQTKIKRLLGLPECGQRTASWIIQPRRSRARTSKFASRNWSGG